MTLSIIYEDDFTGEVQDSNCHWHSSSSAFHDFLMSEADRKYDQQKGGKR